MNANLYNGNNAYLQAMFGSFYLQLSPSTQELLNNYQFLLNEKSKLYQKINNFLFLAENTSTITLEEWELDLLQLLEKPIIYKSKINKFPIYYSLNELKLLELFKKITYKSEELTKDNFDILYDFIRNKGRVESLVEKSGNGLVIDRVILEKILDLTTNRVLTVGKNILTYEKLCNRLGLTKNNTEKKLEYKI